jgi:hypothetical protein
VDIFRRGDAYVRGCGAHTRSTKIAEIELIGVPFDGYGRPGNQARAAAALRDAGLLDAFEHHHVAGHVDLDLPAGDSRRGQTSLINERALMAMTRALNERVGSAVSDGRLPIVYGGDCSTLLGIVTGLRDHVGEVGLVFIDGHEDSMPLDVSEDGEAANAELGLLLGLTGRTRRCDATGSWCWVRATTRGGSGSTSARSPTTECGWRRWPKWPTIRQAPDAVLSSSWPNGSTDGGCTSISTCWIRRCFRRRVCPTSQMSPAV